MQDLEDVGSVLGGNRMSFEAMNFKNEKRSHEDRES